MNRGSGETNPIRTRNILGFNEAPIHESGKHPAVIPIGLGPACFNEAPIHESGKNDRVRDRYRNLRASMRPRFMNRGSRLQSTPITPLRGFNEAPIHESGKEDARLRPAHARAASMRPRFMNRGRVAGLRKEVKSMRLQ